MIIFHCNAKLNKWDRTWTSSMKLHSDINEIPTKNFLTRMMKVSMYHLYFFRENRSYLWWFFPLKIQFLYMCINMDHISRLNYGCCQVTTWLKLITGLVSLILPFSLIFCQASLINLKFPRQHIVYTCMHACTPGRVGFHYLKQKETPHF